MADSGKNYSVRSVDRAIGILQALANADSPLPLTQLAEHLGGSKSAIFSTVQTLVGHGFILSTGTGLERRYQLGLELARLGDLALDRFSFGAIARPTLEALSGETGLASRAAVLEDGCAFAVGRVDGRSGVKFNLHMGQRELLHSTSVGKALLSTLSDDEAFALVGEPPWVKRTVKTIENAEDLLRDLRHTRERGYAIDDEEDAEGILCIGAPVLDRQGNCQGAISVSRIKADIGQQELAALGDVIVRHALSLSAALGGDESS